MKKKLLFISIVLVGIILITFTILLLSGRSFFVKKNKMYFALAGPMTGRSSLHGTRMLQGVRLFMDDFNKTNKDISLELLVFDDKNDKRKAMQIASDIVSNDNVLLVLGHYGSEPSAAAGEVYKMNGMPVITASATANIVTEQNDWYFRTVAENRFSGSFIANYIYSSLNIDKVSIIFDEDYYGVSLVKAFEKTALELDLKVMSKWGLHTDKEDIDKNLQLIINEIKASEDPGAIFLALHGEESAKVVMSLKYPGTNYTVVGADALSSEACFDYLKRSHMERIIPGYHTDNTYALSHFIPDLSNEKASLFRKKYLNKYFQEPSWVSTTYYDAIFLAAEAIERAEIQDVKNIRKQRKHIKEALTRMNSPESSVMGICGSIYFNSIGDVNKSMSMGVYQKQKLLPFYYQYKLVSETKKETLKDSLYSSHDSITVDGKKMEKFMVVYTGIDINQISNFDIKTLTCVLDFYIWFRFAEDFEDRHIEFTNAVHPIKLNRPIMELKTDNIKVRVYRVKGLFKIQHDSHKFPFGQQAARISIRHQTIPNNRLIFVPDKLGMSDFETEKRNIDCYQDTVHKPIYSGKYLEKSIVDYSQFNAVIQYKRNKIVLIIKFFFPILASALMLSFSYFLPLSMFSVRMLILAAATLTTLFYNIWLNLFFPLTYTPYIEYVSFGFYALAAISLLFFIHIKKLLKKNAKEKSKSSVMG
ncbi:branched chain amino acid ABC transporter (substrate-binding protein) [Candidatus Magnetomorum sp. HK-1]|nr:branched chain amino acid ABC transporter (substrate-binding protein) [Candidatus Magnetomorum sp. HK-1]